MATSSSDESTAPKVFHLSSSLDSGSRLSPNKRRCPLCNHYKITFHCKDCVSKGLFYHSKSNATEAYIDKRRNLLLLDEKRRALEEECLALLEISIRADMLRTKIRQCREKNRLLRLLNEEKKEKREKQLKRLKDLRERNEEIRKSLPLYGQKVQVFKYKLDGKREENDICCRNIETDKTVVKRFVKIRVGQLMKYIFRIEEVEAKVVMESSESDDMVRALAEASNTNYIYDRNNRWELAESTIESYYSVIAPTLPKSGNYSAYNAWVARIREGIPANDSTENIEMNPAYSVNAGLMYTAQLLCILAYYLNIRLPRRLNFTEFRNFEMNEKQFGQRVANINANVLYLCFTQNVDLIRLHSCHETVYNLLQLVDTNNKHLGRDGPMEVDPDFASSLEEPLTPDLAGSDSDSEEWEAVPNIQCPEAPAGAQSIPAIPTQQASSVAGGLVNSAAAGIASIWRGFAGLR